MPQLFFRPKYVWFPAHLKGPVIPDLSGQLAELIAYITSTRVDLYSHQILLLLHQALVWMASIVLEAKLVTEMLIVALQQIIIRLVQMHFPHVDGLVQERRNSHC